MQCYNNLTLINMDKQIVVLAAGKGTRMKSELPKVLTPLHGKPLIKHLLEEIAKVNQATEPVIVIGHKKELVQEELGQSYLYAIQEQQNGTGHAVLSSKSQITAQNIVVLSGDIPLIKSSSIERLFDKHIEDNAVLSMFTCVVPSYTRIYENFLNFGRIIRDTQGKVVKITEYADASEEEKNMKEVNSGIYIFNTEWLWENLEKINQDNAQGEFYLTDLIELAILQQKPIATCNIAAKEMIGINTPEQLKYTHSLIRPNGEKISHRKTFVFWFSYILGTLLIASIFVAAALVMAQLFSNLTYQIITFFITTIFLSNILAKFYIVADKFLQRRFDQAYE